MTWLPTTLSPTRQASRLDRKVVRDEFKRRFSASAIAHCYVAEYDALLATRAASPRMPSGTLDALAPKRISLRAPIAPVAA